MSANPAAVDDSGWTPLHIASSVGAVEIVEMLVVAEAEIEAQNESGRKSRQIFLFFKRSH